VLSVIVGGARAVPHEAGHIAGLVAATSVVFWLAHVYAHALGESIGHDRHLSGKAVLGVARHEASIIEAAVPPVVVLLLAELGVLSTSVAIWVAFVLGLVILAAQGLTVARLEHLGLLATVGVVAINLGLGVVLVGLKLVIAH
jgi:hypothetical protein